MGSPGYGHAYAMVNVVFVCFSAAAGSTQAIDWVQADSFMCSQGSLQTNKADFKLQI